MMTVIPLAAPCASLSFESFTPGESITSQIPGLTIENAIILTAGVNYNDAELPPRSGSNVLSDDGGFIGILFATPLLNFGAYFSYLQPVTLVAYNALNNVLATDISLFASNLALSGDPGSSPNEFLQVSHASGISRIVIEGNPGGGSYVLDDAEFVESVADVPEPGTFAISGMVLSIALITRRVRKARRCEPAIF
jgi:hypothetical protein